MGINLNQLKEKSIKREFMYEGAKIIVKNPTIEQQNIIKEKIKNSIKIVENKINIEISDVEVLSFLFNELVYTVENDVESSLLIGMSKEEISDAFSNPNELLEDINYEITDIIKRISKNSVREYMNQLEMLEGKLEEKELIDKLQDINKKGNLNMDLSAINWNPEINTNEDKQIINKPKKKSRKKKEVDSSVNI